MLHTPASPLFVLCARRRFASFYARARASEADLMDALVITRATLRSCIGVPREGVMPTARSQFERAGTEVEHFFTALREAVRDTTAFRGLPRPEREMIERDVFEVCVPVLD